MEGRNQMSQLYHDKDFNDHDYDEFYESHTFAPLSDETALDAHRILPRVAWALDIAKEIKPKRVLDLGCLEGLSVLTIAKHVPSVKVGVGIDLSRDGIKLAIKRSVSSGLPTTFFRDSIENYLQSASERFDMIMLFEVMEHVKDPELIIKLVDKVLAPGGTVLISTPAFESPTYGKDDEQNKCHVRLYTLKDEDYQEENKYGTLRTATSLPKQLKGHTIVSTDIYSELIHARYTK